MSTVMIALGLAISQTQTLVTEGGGTPPITSPAAFNHVITGQMENQISILFQRLWLPNLAACELREDVPHPLNHLSF